jgi:histidyl-tRNA synthetase
MAKPSLPQGTRDFGPETVRKRNHILDTIRNVFELYGFQPLETPAMENLETLMGKYGDEGDKLIFKILNNGLDNPEKQKQGREDFEKILQGKNVKTITERALKYDLTIPFARYVAMNHNQLAFPFKRYQVQPVWRADRPQKGRYREFYQCDADVVGSNSLINEVELACIYMEVFRRLKIADCQLQINHRKVLRGIIETCNLHDHEKKILVIIDKTDKIGIAGVKEELIKEKIEGGNLEKLMEAYSFEGSTQEKISFLKNFLKDSQTGTEGITDLEYIFNQSAIANLKSKIQIDLTLARGLEYYTGIIFEAKAPEKIKIGSIGGGGRYDDLTGLFDVPNIPGVGISFGVDRIYDVMEELDLFPAAVHVGTQVLFFNLGEAEARVAFILVQQLRHHGTRTELYPESAKFDKQFKYAEKKNIPYIIIIGSKELEEKKVVVKDLRTAEQNNVAFEDLVSFRFD